jgi:hypothetical protein
MFGYICVLIQNLYLIENMTYNDREKGSG